jgi:hypothetical protein
MSRGVHARPSKPRRRPGQRVTTVLTVIGVLIGLATCATIGWTVVTLTIRAGVLAGAGLLVGIILAVALAWLAISRRRAHAIGAAR